MFSIRNNNKFCENNLTRKKIDTYLKDSQLSPTLL